MRHRLIHNQILASLPDKYPNIVEFYKDLYINKKMSGIEISEYIKQNTNLSITPRSIQRTLAKKGLMREVGDSFRLAVKKGRVQWKYKEFKVKRRKLNPKLRYGILKRDGFKCVLCGATAETDLLEVDHIKPSFKGGLSVESNLRTLCYSCNQGKRIEEREK